MYNFNKNFSLFSLYIMFYRFDANYDKSLWYWGKQIGQNIWSADRSIDEGTYWRDKKVYRREGCRVDDFGVKI